MHQGEHAKEELRVFCQFAKVCGLFILPSTIEKRPDGEPDILSETADERAIAFEMTKLIDGERIVRPHSDDVELLVCIQNYPKLLLDSTQRYLRRIFRNARITLYFSRETRLLLRKAATKEIFAALLELDENFAGRVPLKGKLASIVAIEVMRASSDIGLCFSVSSGGSFHPLPIESVERKLKKNYKTKTPIELLAYYGLGSPPVPSEALLRAIDQLRALLRESMDQSPFRRVWLFDLASSEIKFVYPESDPVCSTMRSQ